jgi:hypothetical protein
MMSIYSLRPFFFFFLGLSVCSSSRVGLREKSIPDEVSGIKDLEERLFS